MFGVANQLLAAIALSIGTTFLLRAGKAKYAWVTFIPMAFMFTTSLTASWELITMFIDKASKAASSSEALTLKIDALFMVTMALLTVIVLADIAYKWYGLFSKKHTIN